VKICQQQFGKRHFKIRVSKASFSKKAGEKVSFLEGKEEFGKEESGDDGNGRGIQSPNEELTREFGAVVEHAQNDSTETSKNAGKKVAKPPPIAVSDTSFLNDGKKLLPSRPPDDNAPKAEKKNLDSVLKFEGKDVDSKLYNCDSILEEARGKHYIIFDPGGDLMEPDKQKSFDKEFDKLSFKSVFIPKSAKS
jgi:hypothetical protein